VLNFGSGGSTWCRGQIGHYAIPGTRLRVAVALLPATPDLEPLRVSQSGGAVRLELHLPADQPGFLVYCRLDATPGEIASLRRQVNRDLNLRQSAWIVAAMVLLLALCGWIAGGARGAHQAVAQGIRRPDEPTRSRNIMLRWFGARPLHPVDIPELFHILVEVCRRARLFRLPELYYVAAPAMMNAYACGGPENSAIIVTDGLLRGMSLDEIAGILAHEVAHICNQDARAMDWASALNRAIEWVSSTGLAWLHTRSGRVPIDSKLGNLLIAAPAIGRLLFLALSRIRELDADATALDLTGDMRALVAALAKLECHHTGLFNLTSAAFDDGPMRFLRSHPATAERVDTLLNLAH
jgi:heat shock protein HtpX